MEQLQTALAQFIDTDKLQRSVPEYLWFLIAIGGLILFGVVVKFLISNLKELKKESAQHAKEIAVIHETLRGIKDILITYGSDIRELRNKRRGQ